MRNRKTAVLFGALLGLILGLSLLRWVHRPPESTPSSETLPQNAAPPPLTDTPSRIPPQNALATPPPRTEPKITAPMASGSTDSPSPNSVPFEVVNGLAISYGDVMLGKVEGGAANQTHGRYEPPSPLLWDTAEIPYAINPNVINPKRVEKAIEYFNKNTTVRFVPYQGEKDAVVFEHGDEHCYSYLGKVGGLQPISLADACQTQEILHELMHALGFVHEQSRTDRDQYVEILWPNIEEKYKAQFEIVPEAWMSPLKGTSFDFHSVMLYTPNAFAIKPDLESLKARSTEPIAPTRDGLSAMDIKRLSLAYPR